MRYEQFYNEQVELYKKRRIFLTKKLPLIFLGIGILLAAILALFFTSGIPYDYGIHDLKYGTSVGAAPKSFLASAEYQYLIDGEYTTVAPEEPGTYTYRVASKSIFGITKYSKEGTFTITKGLVTVKILDDTVDYGVDPSNIKTNLPYDESLSSYKISYENKHLLTTNAWVSDIVISDSEGNDITSYYEIETPAKEITFTKIPVVITLKDKEKEYDGTPLTYSSAEDYTIEGLVNGDEEISIEVNGSQTLVGTSEYSVTSVLITDSNGISYETYDYVFNPGKLTVIEKNITLTTEDTILTYNGEDQELSSYTLSATINDTVLLTPLIVNLVGEYEYALSPTFQNEAGEDVSSCYKVDYVFGKVTVNPAFISISLKDKTEEYTGGTSFEAEYEVTSGSLFGATLQIIGESSIREVGTGDFVVKSYAVYKGTANVTTSYQIDFTDSFITITPKEITVKPKNVTKEYDGTSYEATITTMDGLASGDKFNGKVSSTGVDIGTYDISFDSYTIFANGIDVTSSYSITEEVGTLTITKINAEISIEDLEITYGESLSFTYTSSGLFDGDTVTVNSYTFSTNVGENEISTTDYQVWNGSLDHTDLYEFTINKGILTINKKGLTLAIYSKSKTYDGTPLGVSTSDYYILEGELNSTDFITYLPSSTTLTNVGEQVIAFDETNITIKNSFDADVKDFYSITYIEGKITITKRELIITTGSISKPYDYGVLTYDSYTYSGLVSGHTIEIEITGELFYIGSTENTAENAKVLFGTENVTSNYLITIYEGTLTYTERGA